MVIDPVCRKLVFDERTAVNSEHKGETYYFCSPHCKKDFDKEPGYYARCEDKDNDRPGHCGACSH